MNLSVRSRLSICKRARALPGNRTQAGQGNEQPSLIGNFTTVSVTLLRLDFPDMILVSPAWAIYAQRRG